jgi:hypothetical protein
LTVGLVRLIHAQFVGYLSPKNLDQLIPPLIDTPKCDTEQVLRKSSTNFQLDVRPGASGSYKGLCEPCQYPDKSNYLLTLVNKLSQTGIICALLNTSLMMQIFNLIILFVILCFECVHQNPDFKIIIHLDESGETVTGIPIMGSGSNGENRVGGTTYQA